nr:dnaJ homolog subfamily A member 2-like [Cherax quadricarinatus]
MPFHKNPFEKGDLYVRIEVEFPDNYFASEGKLKELEAILGGRPAAPALPEDAEEVNMSDIEETPSMGGNRGQYYDEDDDHPHMGGQHVQCAHQ